MIHSTFFLRTLTEVAIFGRVVLFDRRVVAVLRVPLEVRRGLIQLLLHLHVQVVDDLNGLRDCGYLRLDLLGDLLVLHYGVRLLNLLLGEAGSEV